MYFAYGSNMDISELKRYGVRVDSARGKQADLPGYVLKFNKSATGEKAKSGEGKGNIEPDPDGVVEGILWEVRPKDMSKLARKEGARIGHYRRMRVRVHLADGTEEEAVTYIANPSMTKEGLKPTKEYLGHYLKGKDLLSEKYYRWLESIETLDPPS